MVPFRYVEFYDVLRLIALSYKGKLLLLQSAFSDTLDEYPNVYSVYDYPMRLRLCWPPDHGIFCNR